MPDYVAIATKVKDGLSRAGSVMTLQRITKGTYDPALGTFGADSTEDYLVVGLCLSGGKPGNESGQRYFKGVLVQTDDQVVLISSSELAIIPGPGDKITIGAVIWNVVSQVPVNPGVVDLMYYLLLRQ
jgi:hypothetical protein